MGCWRIELEKSVYGNIPSDANIIAGRFMLTLKTFWTSDRIPKVRYIAQGHVDSEISLMVHDVSSLHPTTIIINMDIATVCDIQLFPHDVNGAYLQSHRPSTTYIYDHSVRTQAYFRLKVMKLSSSKSLARVFSIQEIIKIAP